MDKPAVITITDDSDEVVYMQFIDISRIPEYTEALDKMNGDYVEILDKESGQTFYTLGDYVKNLLEEPEGKYGDWRDNPGNYGE